MHSGTKYSIEATRAKGVMIKDDTVPFESPNWVASWGYVVFHDTFMSGWGRCPGRSFYAIAVETEEQANVVLANGKARSEMKRGRIVRVMDNTCKPLRAGDHLKIVDKTEARRWFEPGAFANKTRLDH